MGDTSKKWTLFFVFKVYICHTYIMYTCDLHSGCMRSIFLKTDGDAKHVSQADLRCFTAGSQYFLNFEIRQRCIFLNSCLEVRGTGEN